MKTPCGVSRKISDTARESNCEDGGSPVIGRAQGWRFAPPPPAASALTATAHRSARLPSGRRDAPTTRRCGRSSYDGGWARRRIPYLTPREHGVQNNDQLAHAGDQGDLRRLALGAQPLVVRLDDRVVPGRGAEGRHIEQGADFLSSALDVTFAFVRAAVVVVRGGADESGGDLAVDPTELRHPGDEAGGGLAGKPGDAFNDLCPGRERLARGNRVSDRGLELGELGAHRLGDRAMRFLDRAWLAMLAVIPDLRQQLHQCRASGHQEIERLAIRVIELARSGGERLGEPGDHRRVDRVVLGKTSRRFGEVANPLGIDDPDSDAGRAQSLGPTPFISATGLHHRRRNAVLAQPSDHLLLTLQRARPRQTDPQRPDKPIDLRLRNVDADNPAVLCHPPIPFLARPGSHALATVRVKGRHRTSPSLSLRFCLGWPRAQVQRRAVFRATARSHILADFRHTRWWVPYQANLLRRDSTCGSKCVANCL